MDRKILKDGFACPFVGDTFKAFDILNYRFRYIRIGADLGFVEKRQLTDALLGSTFA